MDIIRGSTLIHGMTRALCGIPAYPRQLTYASTLQNTKQIENLLFPAPSAVHLMTCFPPVLSTPGSLWEHHHLYLRFNGLK